MAGETFYVAVKGDTSGPYPAAEIQSAYAEGRFDNDAQVHDGKGWMPIATFLAGRGLPTSPPSPVAARMAAVAPRQASPPAAATAPPKLGPAPEAAPPPKVDPTTDFDPAAGMSGDDLEQLMEAEEQIGKAFKAGVVISILYALIGLVLFSISYVPFGPVKVPGWMVGTVQMVLAALLLGFSFGVRHNSRVCAILLFGLYVLDKIGYWTQSGGMMGGIWIWILTLVVAYWFLMAIFATFTVHTINAKVDEMRGK